MTKKFSDQKIVIIGGGSGLANLLRGLKNHTKNISAIVTMTDDGKSTGRLRHDFNVLPPGDIRHCIVALSAESEENIFEKIMSYRFEHGRGLGGHSLGNLMLSALAEITGSFKKAVQEMSRILNIVGQVLPSTYEDVNLSAKLANGHTVWGESNISTAGHRSPIREISLHPESAVANQDAVTAINEADLILIGPGSLYTSIIPNFLLSDINSAVSASQAKKIFICNVSTERGETENYSVEDHIRTLVKHSDDKVLDTVLVNTNILLKTGGKRLGEVRNITTDKTEILGYKILRADLISAENPLYHDARKVIELIKN